MRTLTWGFVIGIGIVIIAPRVEAAGACQCRFEVAGADGSPLSVTRATKATDGTGCAFDVRLRVADPQRCTGTQAVVRGVAAGRATTGWGEAWERVTLKARPHRRVLRARVRGESGATGRARLSLRCRPRFALQGCDAIEAESVSCFLGGGVRIRIVGLDTGAVCPEGLETAGPELSSENLAVWNGVAYTCPGSSLTGAFVATPADGGESRTVAGPCAAVTTDGQSLYVLPHESFDTQSPPELFPTGSTTRPDLTPIRGYDVPESIPAGPYRVAFDPAALPADSPCTGIAFKHLAAHDGLLYASGCRPVAGGGCTPASQICVLDTRTGSALPPLTLEDFSGPIRGMSAIDGGRLLVLTDDQTSVPPIGYVPTADTNFTSGPIAPAGMPRIHIFDTTTGARLDTRAVGTFTASGISCAPRAQ